MYGPFASERNGRFPLLSLFAACTDSYVTMKGYPQISKDETLMGFCESFMKSLCFHSMEFPR